MLSEYLKKFGLTEKETAIYLSLAELGIQPASVIARKCAFDRVTTYKNLKRLSEQGLVKIYAREGTQCFGIENPSELSVQLHEQIDRYTGLMEDLPLVENLIKSLQGQSDIIPKLQIFEGESGIKAFFRDLLYETKTEDIHQIRMLTSNTFEERLGDVPLSRFIQEFYTELKKRKVDLEIYEASGTLIPERLRQVSVESFDPSKLPAAKGTTSIFLAGHSVYLACYKTAPVGLKIKQAEMSQMLHFLFDLFGKM